MAGDTSGTAGVSVVIPHLNQPAFLRRCLTSLVSGAYRPDEIIVVDNGSAELPEALCAEFENVQLLSQPEPGPGPARNLGVAAARHDILAFIDADCLADPDWLAVAVREMANPKTGILGGDVRIALADPKRLTVLEAYESIYAYRMDRYIAREGFTGTGNLVVRRHVLDAVGPFAGLSVAEDRDWGQRATAQGYTIRYVPALRVYHPARKDFSELRQKWDRHMAHDFSVVRGKPANRLKWGVKTVAMLASPMFELPRILTSDRVPGIHNKILAYVGLVRIRGYRFRRMVQLLTTVDPDDLSVQWNRQGSD